MLRIGFVLVPNFQVMSFAAMSVFEFANVSAGEKLYDVRYLSEGGGLLGGSMNMAIQTEAFGGEPFDTLIFCSGIGIRTGSPALLQYARDALEASRRVASICMGAFLLAEAGVLDGRRATTHWLGAQDLADRYPKVRMEEDRIFIIDGPVWTSAGMSAGMDMALGMLEKDFGGELARVVAQKLVLYHRRAGGQSQHSALLEMNPKSDRIQNALAYARNNLRKALTVEELAEAACLSPRQFSRAFSAETGQSPAKAVESLRLEAARLMMEQSRHTVDVVAEETGFGDRERMRRAFVRAFGQPPQALRRAAREEALVS